MEGPYFITDFKRYPSAWYVREGVYFHRMKYRVLLLVENACDWLVPPKSLHPEYRHAMDIKVQNSGRFLDEDWGGKKRTRFFRQMEKTFFGTAEIPWEQRRMFWETVALDRFLPDSTDVMTDPPTREVYAEAWIYFFNLFCRMKTLPTHIILFGTRPVKYFFNPYPGDFRIEPFIKEPPLNGTAPYGSRLTVLHPLDSDPEKKSRRQISIRVVRGLGPGYSWRSWHEYLHPFLAPFHREFTDYYPRLTRLTDEYVWKFWWNWDFSGKKKS